LKGGAVQPEVYVKRYTSISSVIDMLIYQKAKWEAEA
jgi:hypothetical protein